VSLKVIRYIPRLLLHCCLLALGYVTASLWLLVLCMHIYLHGTVLATNHDLSFQFAERI
jgi:hypothetical protein